MPKSSWDFARLVVPTKLASDEHVGSFLGISCLPTIDTLPDYLRREKKRQNGLLAVDVLEQE